MYPNKQVSATRQHGRPARPAATGKIERTVMAQSSRAGRRHAARDLAPKVPEITALFWVVKVLTTGMGEAASDFLANRNVTVGAAVGLLGFALAMVLQLRTRRYVTAVYWFAVAMVAVFGTMAADGFHKFLGLPYTVTTTGYAIALAVIFYLWRRSEHTLSIHSVTTRRREIYYWLTVLATFALGTAAGDFSAFTLNLGFATSIIFYAVVILIPLVGYKMGWMNEVLAFWFAYVLTRPLGASIADWLGKAHSMGGLAFGDGTVTVAATILIIGLVAYLAWSGTDVQRPIAPVVPAPHGRAAVPAQYGEPYRAPARDAYRGDPYRGDAYSGEPARDAYRGDPYRGETYRGDIYRGEPAREASWDQHGERSPRPEPNESW
jgi:uncharacterized membrane-anchored protein